MSSANPWRIGLGPVFAYERIAASRRWQGYALRSLFLLALLAALILVWERTNRRAPASAISYYTELARSVFIGVVGTQLALVLLAAPAATAGAICLDRVRGTLTHMLLTDLSDAEIVLGKLAARLLPVLSLLVCTLPLMAIVSLLGGVDPAALMSALVVAMSVALLGCALAMLLSLLLPKTHQALLATYALLGAWLMTWPLLEMIALKTGWFWILPTQKINPFYMAVAPYWQPGDVTLGDYLLFTAAIGLLSLLFVALTVLEIRAVCTRERARKERPAPPVVPRGSLWRLLGRNVPWLTPSLDANPVVWREWYRGRPSRWRVVVTAIYVSVSTIFSVLAIIGPGGEFGPIVNAIQVAIGLLLLSVWSATGLAEERARGSLDSLMCTQLSTRQIVTGKWLGAFRAAPLLAILPSFVVGFNAYIADRNLILASCCMFIYVLCAGAAVTSLGILMATWFSRLGRAVAVTVAVYALVTVGWWFVIASLRTGPEGDELIMASPFYWTGRMTYEFGRRQIVESTDWAIFWTGVALILAVMMLDCAIRDFDRRLGRVEELLARLGRPSRWAGLGGLIYFASAALVLPFALLWHRDGAIIIALEFTLGSVVVAAMAASSSDLKLPGGVEDVAGFRLSPPQIVRAKWSGAYRYALMFMMIPLFINFTGIGLDFARWKEVLLAMGYMLAVSAAATSLGLAMFTWFRRSRQAALVAMLTWGVAVIPWFALAKATPGGALEDALSMSSPILAMEALTRAVSGDRATWGSGALLWIVVYSALAALLFRAAQARCARHRKSKDSAIVIPIRAVPQLTTDN